MGLFGHLVRGITNNSEPQDYSRANDRRLDKARTRDNASQVDIVLSCHGTVLALTVGPRRPCVNKV